MKYFVVFAHPDPVHSFNAALLAHGVEALRAAGHEVRVSNLYEMEFNPVASARDFPVRRFPDRLQYDREQKHAAATGAIAPDIAAELEKLFWCDNLVLQFPLYWFSMPAILKGWVDRVFMNAVVYGKGMRYDTGGLAGRRAMVATTTGGSEAMFMPDGLLGDHRRALWPIHNGILHYTGMTVTPPFLGWSPVFGNAAETADLFETYSRRLLEMPEAEPLKFHILADFDEHHRMKAEVEPRSDGHWRPAT